jgi:hypothetical protein
MQNAEESPTKDELLLGLAMHTGSETWFRHWSGRFVYTEGVQYLAEKANGYWLIDLIASWCGRDTIRHEPFVFWKLTVKADRSATAVAENGNDRELARQDIAWTDFPLDEVSFYLTDSTLLLPREY